MVSPNLLHVSQLDSGSVVQPCLISFGICSTHTFTINSNELEFFKLLLYFAVVVLLMPNTKNTTTPTTASLVSPSPNISQSRSFTVTNFLTIDDYLFKFGGHPHCERFAEALNDTYSKLLEDTVVASLFTYAGRTTVATAVIVIIQAAVINIIDATSLADCAIITPIINTLILSTVAAAPPRRFCYIQLKLSKMR